VDVNERPTCDIPGSHGGKYIDDYLLGYSKCSLVELDQRFRGVYYIHHQVDESDDGGSKQLWNVRLLQ
jgi:hypothetical protein